MVVGILGLIRGSVRWAGVGSRRSAGLLLVGALVVLSAAGALLPKSVPAMTQRVGPANSTAAALTGETAADAPTHALATIAIRSPAHSAAPSATTDSLPVQQESRQVMTPAQTTPAITSTRQLPGKAVAAAAARAAADARTKLAAQVKLAAAGIAEASASAVAHRAAVAVQQAEVQRSLTVAASRQAVADASAATKAAASMSAAASSRSASAALETPSSQPATTNASCGAPSNPYGFNYCGQGATIDSPPGDICTYFQCIANFSAGKGYMEECADGSVSMSGGRRGACSSHGGELTAVTR